MELNNKSGIYKIENLKTGVIYIGSSVNINRRKGAHFSALNRGVHRNPRLQHSYNSHNNNSDIFEFSTIEFCEQDIIVEREQYWLDHYKNIGDVYNCGTVVEATFLGRHHSEETKRNISKNGSGERHHQFGKPIPDEQKDKISDSTTGEKHWNYGNKYSQERKDKMAESKRGIGYRKVVQIDKNTGEIVKIYNSMAEAGRKVGCLPCGISQVCKGQRITAAGYFWKYLEEI